MEIRTIHFSLDQQRALDVIKAFIEGNVVRRYLSVGGLAGTGKSYLAAHVARCYPGSVLCAYTWKAALVLRVRTGLPVSTVHSAIYRFLGLDEDDELIFTSNEIDRSHQLVLVDESSMLGTEIAEDLLATGAKVLAFGDPGQLPPVNDEQFFTEADVTLTEIHRQALESPIVRQAHRVRSEGEYTSDTDGFRVVKRATDEDLREASICLCWRNRTRLALGTRRREVFGYTGSTIYEGEPVICGRNDHRLGIFNGEIYEVAADRPPGHWLLIRVGKRVVCVPNALVEGIDLEYDALKNADRFVPFQLGYAITIHRAQGSEWPSVLIVDEMNKDDRRALLYTAITRAVERVTIVRPG